MENQINQCDTKVFDGIEFRQTAKYSKVWVALDGRVIGTRGKRLKPLLLKDGYYRLGRTGADNSGGYALIHRIVATAWLLNPEELPQVDHINGDKANNAASNLRWVTSQQNQQNLRCRREGRASSQYVGVSWDKLTGKWQARIHFEGIRRHLGRYTNETEAATAYDDALIGLGLRPVNYQQ